MVGSTVNSPSPGCADVVHLRLYSHKIMSSEVKAYFRGCGVRHKSRNTIFLP
jgi:hypothetical protein